MLLPPPVSSERAQALAARLGCTVGLCAPSTGPALPALLGSTASFLATLSEFGARFDAQEKVHVFATWHTLEAALQHVIDQRRPTGS